MTARCTPALGTAAVAIAVLAALTGCSVPGTGIAQSSDVAQYDSMIASSKAADAAAAADAARKAACPQWRSGNATRTAVTEETVRIINTTRGATWQSIAPRVQLNYDAIAAESSKLGPIIATAIPNDAVHSGLVTYREKLDAYSAAWRTDQQAARTGDQSFITVNPAAAALKMATATLNRACQLI